MVLDRERQEVGNVNSILIDDREKKGRFLELVLGERCRNSVARRGDFACAEGYGGGWSSLLR